jgi:hypothetical protein
MAVLRFCMVKAITNAQNSALPKFIFSFIIGKAFKFQQAARFRISLDKVARVVDLHNLNFNSRIFLY